MPEGRNMVDNVLLPNGQVLLVNGAGVSVNSPSALGPLGLTGQVLTGKATTFVPS